MSESRLLELDGIGNVVLGMPLVLYPKVVAELLGIPYGDQGFYPTILGALLIGIGGALLIERFISGLHGLALAGAVTINLSFGVVLAAWLLRNSSSIPARGNVLLWLLVVILVGLSLIELFSVRKKETR